MQFSSSALGRAAVLCALMMSASPAAYAACTTATACADPPTVVGTLGGSDSISGLHGISGDGSTVVGYSFPAGDGVGHAFRYANGVISDLGSLSAFFSSAEGASFDGSVVTGSSQTDMGSAHAFRWTQAGGMVDLGTLGGDISQGFGVNHDGSVIVGYSTDLSRNQRAFRWTTTEGMHDLGTLAGDDGSVAYDVDASGSTVVGYSFGSTQRAFRYTSTWCACS